MPATIPLLQEGRFTIEQELPNGDNCFLFEAYDTANETPVTIVEVALCLPRVATTTQREAANAAFSEQAKILAGFKHPSIVAVLAHFTESGRNYLVTDRLTGVDLGSLLSDQKQPVKVAQMTTWAETVLDVLNGLHNARPPLIYRYIRPQNIILRPDGNVQLVMAGMMRFGDQGLPISYSPLEQIWPGLDAASQKVVISKYDDASERMLKQDLDGKSDLFSLGATLYKLVTGQTPVDALERSIEMIEGNPDPLQSPKKVNASVPVEVSDVIMKAMEIRREYRFDSAAIMRQVLKTALVRVREREAEESLGQKIAEQDLRPAVQNVVSTPATQADEDAVMKRLREAEEKRLEAERRAAEAEKKLRETEAAQAGRVTETLNVVELEDDLLGLLSPSAHTSEPPQSYAASAIGPPFGRQKDEEVPPSLQAAASVPKEVSIDEPAVAEQASEEIWPHSDETVPVEPNRLEDEAETGIHETSQPENTIESPTETPEPAGAAAAAFSVAGDDELFSEHRPGGGIGLPAIAAAAAVLIIAAVGGWFYLGSKPTPAVTAETPAATEPAPGQPERNAFQPAEQPSTETAANPASDQPVELPGDALQDPQAQKPVSSAPAKAKKPAQGPSRPAQKKNVTVDDLINDN